jgi:D-inositol-3-phosphate glycosyltransferase
MACARPVLGVREGGVVETVVEGETGFLADRDPAAFGHRIAELLADPDTTGIIARGAARRVRERWSWERSVAELAELLAAAAGKQR